MFKYRWIFVFLYFIVTSTEHSDAQSYALKHYSTSDGLNSSVVYSCTQDSKGYIWFCTDAGVSRFDGKRFEQFTTREGLSGNEVFRLFEDSKKRLWFLTYNGHLSYYKDGVIYNENNQPALRKLYIGESYTNAFEDHKGNIYFGSFSSKFIVLRNDSVAVVDYPFAFGTFNFFENKNGEMFISSNFDRKKLVGNKLIDAPLKNKKYDVRYITSKFANNYYFSDSGLVRVSDGDENVIIPHSLLPPYDAITGCMENNDTGLFISTRGNGAQFFHKVNGSLKKAGEKILADKTILSVYEDRENNTWFNTEGDGVYMMSMENKRCKNYTAEDGLASTNIRRIIKGPDGSLWLACRKGLVVNIQKDTVVNYYLSSNLRNVDGRILDMVFDREDHLWCATDFGIFKFNKYGKNQPIPIIVNGEINQLSGKSISCDGDNNIIVSYSFGVAKLMRNPKTGKEEFTKTQQINIQTRTYTHLLDHSNRYWVANINGLNLWDGSRLICYGDSDNLLKAGIQHMIEIGDTLVLSTNENGVIFFRNGKVIKTLTVEDGLPSDICKNICYYHNNLWIGTNRGLAMVELFKGNKYVVRIFNESDGLVSNDVQDVLDDDNIVYVATGNGLTLLEKTKITGPVSPPPVYITSVLVNNKPVLKNKDLISLDYTENTLIINFAAITFRNPHKVNYQYKLSSKNTGWISTRNNSVDFFGLSPGDYIFSVRARKENSEWSNPVNLNFSIQPPMWKSLWFTILLAGCFMLLIVYSIYSFSRRKVKMEIAEIAKRELVLNERGRISSELHDDLGADLSRIVVLSEVVKVTEQLNKNTLTNIDKISQYANDLRAKIDEIIWALNPQHDSLKDLISYVHHYVREYLDENNLNFKIEIPNVIPDVQVSAAFRRNVFLIFKEATHNIVSHASAKFVNISIETDGKQMRALIGDDGDGFEKNSDVAGNGLENMEKRASEIGGVLTITSSRGSGCIIELLSPIKTF